MVKTMTKEQIKNYMLERINETLQNELENLDIPDLVDEEILHEFMWEHDFGYEIARNYIDNNTDTIVHDFLQDIYDSIDSFDLDMPW